MESAQSAAQVSPRFSKAQILLTSAGAEILFVLLAVTGAILANSVTLWTNAARVLLEAGACFLAYYTVWKSKRVSAEVYNYGLGKLENLVSLCAAAVILCTFLIVGWNTINRLLNPVAIEGVGFGLVALGIAGAYNIWIFIQLRNLKRHDSSPVVDAQSVVYLNAIIASAISLLAVLLALLFREYTWARFIDPIGAVALCYFLLRNGLSLMKRSLSPLLDGAIEESSQMLILRGLVEHFDDYEQLGRIRSRRSGSQVFVEVFLQFDPTLEHATVLQRMQAIKQTLERSVPGAEVWVIPDDNRAPEP
ncbi:MAG: cation diffusion facilitator family transporter [Opitutales bacterium]|nr:cation diffusion facilitator family transporter [Opitutales bacterium]